MMIIFYNFYAGCNISVCGEHKRAKSLIVFLLLVRQIVVDRNLFFLIFGYRRVVSTRRINIFMS